MRKRTASGKAHPVGGNHFGVFPWVFVSLRRSFTYDVTPVSQRMQGFSFCPAICCTFDHPKEESRRPPANLREGTLFHFCRFLYPQSQYGPPEARVYSRTKVAEPRASAIV